MMCFISKYDDSVDDVGCLLALGTEMLRSMLRSIIGIVFSILFYNCTFFSHNVLISILTTWNDNWSLNTVAILLKLMKYNRHLVMNRTKIYFLFKVLTVQVEIYIDFLKTTCIYYSGKLRSL